VSDEREQRAVGRMMTEQCLFCAIIDGTEVAYIVGENQNAVAFLDRLPVNSGHTLVIPRQHSDNLFEMTTEVAAGVFALAHETARRLRDVLDVDLALSVLKSNGAAADQSVFHSHVHLIPRYPNDGFALVEEPKPAPVDEQLGKMWSLLSNGR
jgi:histidine triad (HIT) family protein